MVLFRGFKTRVIGKKLAELEATDEQSAVSPKELSLDLTKNPKLKTKLLAYDVIKFTDNNLLFLDLERFLLFKKDYSQRLFLAIFNAAVILVLLLLLAIAWYINIRYRYLVG